MKVIFCGVEFPMCDAYVNLKHWNWVGCDSMGFKCCRIATELENGHELCQHCLNMLHEEPSSITFDYEGKNEVQTKDC